MKTWKLEYSQDSKQWTKIIRSEELKIGSRLGNHLRLPAPCPHHLICIQSTEEGLSWAAKSIEKFPIKRDKGSIVLEWKKKKIKVSDITQSEIHNPLTTQKLKINRSESIKDPTRKTIWYFYKDRLIETTPIHSSDLRINPKANLSCGYHVELDNFSRKLIVTWPTGDLKVLPIKNTDEGFEVVEGPHRFLITSAPDLSQLKTTLPEEEKTRIAPVIFTFMATLLILLAILQISWSPKDGFLEEVLPEELARLTIEKQEKSGLPGGGEGGGGIQTESRDMRGGSGIASPHEVLVKNLNQLAASSGSLIGALSSLDARYSAQAAQAAIGPVGVGGTNPSQGILKALGSMAGSGGGGVGIGGIGTKGFGGGGGGGSGLGFGTAAGSGVGEGKELRAISFESGAGEVRGA
jgi:hypothetical protein